MNPRAFAFGEGQDPLVMISVVLWTLLEVASLIAAVVLIFTSPRLRRAAILVAIAMVLSLVARWVSVAYMRYVMTTDADWAMGGENVSNAMRWGGFVFDKLGLVSKALLILAAFFGARSVIAVTGGTTDATHGVGMASSNATSLSGHTGSSVPLIPASSTPMPSLPPLTKGLRVGGLVLSAVLMLLLTVLAVALAQDRKMANAAFGILALAFLPMILVMVLVTTTLHAAWKTIAAPPTGCGVPGLARTTPGKAVGFLFIPFFNLYWAFQAIPGFATDCNRTLEAMGHAHPSSPRVSRGLGIAWCVCSILGIIPVVGVAVGLAGLVIVPLFLSQAITAANVIRAASRGA